MNKLLKEFLSYILVEAVSATSKQAKDMGLKFIKGSKIYWSKTGQKPASHKTDDSGKIVPVTAQDTQPKQPKKDGTDELPPEVVRVQSPERYRGGGKKPRKSTGPTPEPGKQTVPAPEGPLNTNVADLGVQVRDGIVSPGNDFSRYSESVSILIAVHVVDNPDASDQDTLERIIELDCGSKTLTAGVGVKSIPKHLQDRYKAAKQTGVFDRCPASEEQNKARFMTMVVAQTKAARMRAAIERSKLPSVSMDAFSGDSTSRQRLRSLVEALPEGAKIYTEDGELTKEEALERIAGFGTSRFPADTALVGRDASGSLILLGFSDKKDLSAIINNSSVTKEVEQTRAALDKLLQDGVINEAEHTRLTTVLDEQNEAYAEDESKLQELVTEPARKLAEEATSAELKKFIKKAKTVSDSKTEPDKYWKRVSVFQTAAAAAAKRRGGPTQAQEENYIKWLRHADPNWDGKSKVTEEHAMRAWALKCQHVLSGKDIDPKTGEPRDLPKADQELLFRLEVIPKQEIVERASKIKNDAMGRLETIRNELNTVTVNGTPLGTYMDGVRAWHALHLDMADHKGSLSMVAEDNVVDYRSIEDCLGGVSDDSEFVSQLEIENRDIESRDYGVVTGRNVEIYSLGKDKKRKGIGVRSIRSKDGILGRLQTTWTYHPDFRDCLESKSGNN